jgi:hypothetical protein
VEDDVAGNICQALPNGLAEESVGTGAAGAAAGAAGMSKGEITFVGSSCQGRIVLVSLVAYELEHLRGTQWGWDYLSRLRDTRWVLGTARRIT